MKLDILIIVVFSFLKTKKGYDVCVSFRKASHLLLSFILSLLHHHSPIILGELVDQHFKDLI